MQEKPGIAIASHATTNDALLRLIKSSLTRPLRILDVGCGRGFFLGQMAAIYRERGWPIEGNLLGVDIDLADYQANDVPAQQIDVNQKLPFADATYDVVLAIEVFEHTRAPYLLMQDIARLLAPGGRILLSVPNVMHALSRLSFLASGHYYMYPTPSSRMENAGRLCGHVSPLPLQYWHYGLRTAGFTNITCHIDRVKKGAALAALLLWPVTALGAALYRRRLNRYDAALAEEVTDVLPQVNSFQVLTGRSLILSAHKS
jgi:SAM-dependent methyltransferase